MKKIGLAIILGILFGLALPSHALPPGQTMEFTKSPMGKVTFDGSIHPSKGVMCDEERSFQNYHGRPRWWKLVFYLS